MAAEACCQVSPSAAAESTGRRMPPGAGTDVPTTVSTRCTPPCTARAEPRAEPRENRRRATGHTAANWAPASSRTSRHGTAPSATA